MNGKWVTYIYKGIQSHSLVFIRLNARSRFVYLFLLFFSLTARAARYRITCKVILVFYMYERAE